MYRTPVPEVKADREWSMHWTTIDLDHQYRSIGSWETRVKKVRP